MEESTARILIVDDEPDIRGLLRLLLTGKGYQVEEAENGSSAVEKAEQGAFDLILLDIMMPDMDGVEACQRLRRSSTAPVLFLTAKTQLGDKIAAYSSGGDDFLAKPFAPGELLAKVEALLRRYQVYRGKGQDSSMGEITIDEENRCVQKAGRRIDLTEREFEILHYFFQHQGEILGIPEVYEGAWQEPFIPSSRNTVMVHVVNLRKKLEEDPANPKIIRTIWGKGYQFG